MRYDFTSHYVIPEGVEDAKTQMKLAAIRYTYSSCPADPQAERDALFAQYRAARDAYRDALQDELDTLRQNMSPRECARLDRTRAILQTIEDLS